MRFDNTPLVMFNLTNGDYDGGIDTGNNPNYVEQIPFHDPERINDAASGQPQKAKMINR